MPSDHTATAKWPTRPCGSTDQSDDLLACLYGLYALLCLHFVQEEENFFGFGRLPPPRLAPVTDRGWLTRNVRVLSAVSFLQDAASELLYPLLPMA